MRALLCACLVLLTSVSCTVYPEKTKPAWDSATSGEQHERLFWDAVKAKNWREVDAHFSGTLVTQTPDTVRNKQQTIEHIRQLNLTDYSLGEMQTETSGADLIVTYTFTGTGTMAGQPLPATPMRMMSVWQRVKRGMVMTAHSTMPSSTVNH